MNLRPFHSILLPVLLAGLGLQLAGRASAQTLTVLHTFNAGAYNPSFIYTNSDGADPNSVLISSNTLYGTAYFGGTNGSGRVFKINTDGTGLTNLHTFAADGSLTVSNYATYTNSDGVNPGGFVLSGNTLYGTTAYGNTNGSGTVFKLNIDGTGFTNIYSFSASIPVIGTNGDGAEPVAGLVISNNTLYGAAFSGGTYGNGTVFKVNTDGTGFTNLHTFAASIGLIPNVTYITNLAVITNSDGAHPSCVLALSGNTLYGTTYYGGTNGNGTVFAVNTDGTGFTNLHTFAVGIGTYPNITNSDGAHSGGPLLISGGTWYGAAFHGGTNGNGTLFAISTNGTGFTNLHTFAGGIGSFGKVTNSDGSGPATDFILSNNTLYGTATYGGTFGFGTVFAINTSGAGFTNLHFFSAPSGNAGIYTHGTNSEGAGPSGALVISGNILYGLAYEGGTNGNGTMFSLSLGSVSVPLAVTTTSLPNGTNGIAYSQTLSASGGQTPYLWTNISGALPQGLTLATNGVISGTPTTNGTFNFTVQVTDALSATATQPSTLTVGAPPSVTIQPTNNSVAVMVGNNISFVASVGGTGPFSYQWQLNGSNLPEGIITTVAGTWTQGDSGDGGAATNAELYGPWGVAMDANGNLFIADSTDGRIRKVSVNGIITTVAGGGTNYPGNGGEATNAALNTTYGVAADANGNLFTPDFPKGQIRKVAANGIITTIAGNGTWGFSGDGGAATNAELNAPWGVGADPNGNLFIADFDNSRIRKVGTNGIITTVAGNGKFKYSGDGGAATNAALYEPIGVVLDATGNLFIADYGNNRIRKVGTNGIIITVAGNGTLGYSGDGAAATNAELNNPTRVAVDAIGNLFIADGGNNRIREVGGNGIITTVAGGGTNFIGDGVTATNAEFGGATDVAVDASDNLFIADYGYYHIWKVAIQGPTLVLNGVGVGNAGAYDVVVSGPYGSVTSSVVNLTITLPPVIFSAPHVTGGSTNFTFMLSGPAGSNYVLQVSSNLVNWSSVSTSSIPVSGTITLTNAISGHNNRFYRAYLQ